MCFSGGLDGVLGEKKEEKEKVLNSDGENFQ